MDRHYQGAAHSDGQHGWGQQSPKRILCFAEVPIPFSLSFCLTRTLTVFQFYLFLLFNKVCSFFSLVFSFCYGSTSGFLTGLEPGLPIGAHVIQVWKEVQIFFLSMESLL